MPLTLDELTTMVTNLSEQIDFLLTRDRGLIVLSPIEEAPYGCVPCDGKVYSKDDPMYAALFAKIGFQYPGGDGVTTFAVPDYRNLFPSFHDSSSVRALGSIQEQSTAMPANPFVMGTDGQHTHVLAGGGQHEHRIPLELTASRVAQGGQNNTVANPELGDQGKMTVDCPPHTHTVTDQGSAHGHAIYGGDAETRPRNITMAAFIRY